MDLPLSSTDIRIALACRACHGSGGFGNRTGFLESGTNKPVSSNFRPCASCVGTGWTLKRISELTPAERERLLKKLA